MRAPPQPGVDESRRRPRVPVVHRRCGAADGSGADLGAGERAERDRRVRRTEGRRADRGDRLLAAALGHEREADDVAGLALVGAHAERRVALQVLDRAIALAMRRARCRDGHVVLQIDETLALARADRTAQRRDQPLAVERRAERRRAWRCTSRGRCAAARCDAPAPAAVGEAVLECVKLPCGRAGRTLGLRATRPARSAASVGRRRSVPRACEYRCTAGLPAARDAHEIAVDARRRRALSLRDTHAPRRRDAPSQRLVRPRAPGQRSNAGRARASATADGPTRLARHRRRAAIATPARPRDQARVR